MERISPSPWIQGDDEKWGESPSPGIPVDEIAVLPNGLIFSDFGPNSDFFGDFGPKMVRIGTQKSYLEGEKQRHTTLKAYFKKNVQVKKWLGL